MNDRQAASTAGPVYFCGTPENIGQVRPFYWLLLLVLAAVYAWAVYSSPVLQGLPRLLPFTVLMLGHGGLHWIGPYLTTRRRWLLPYFVVQGALLLAINLLANHQGVMVGLYLAMIGQAVGVLEDVQRSTIVVASYLVLSAGNAVLLFGWAGLPAWLGWVAPLAFFVVVFMLMFVRQAQACAQVQALLHQLEDAHRRLTDYAARVEELALAAERQRMARELHDTLAQGVAGLILQLEAVDSYLEGDNPPRAQAVVQQAMQRARTTLQEARRAIVALRPAELEQEDLVEVLRREVDRFAATSGVEAALEVEGRVEVSPEAAQEILRVVQESLANVARHAQARHVRVRLDGNDAGLRVEVRDDGRGFSPAAAAGPGRFGLAGMRERVQRMGGVLQVESAPGQGTTITLQTRGGAS